MAFAVPNASNTRDVFEIFKFINNSATGGIFFPVILLVVWVIAFIGSLAEGRLASRAWIFASFISTILAILLALMGLLNPNYMYLLVLFVAFGILWIKLEKAPLN